MKITNKVEVAQHGVLWNNIIRLISVEIGTDISTVTEQFEKKNLFLDARKEKVQNSKFNGKI